VLLLQICAESEDLAGAGQILAELEVILGRVQESILWDD